MLAFSMLNVRGLRPRTRPSKVPFIRDIIYDTPHLFFALTETWLHDHTDAELSIEGFTLFRCDRRKIQRRGIRDSGGAAIYIRNEDALGAERVLEFSNGVIEALGVHIKSKNVVVVSAYRQPDNPKQKTRSGSREFKSFLTSLNDTLTGLPTPLPDVLVCGDFNLPHADWNSGKCTSGATTEEKCMVEDLQFLANEHLLNQVIDKSTHKDGNILDLIFTNNLNYIHSFSSIATVLSDHCIVECKVNYTDKKSLSDAYEAPSSHTADEDISFYDLNFFSENINWDSIRTSLSKIDWRFHFRRCTPDQMMESFLSLCLEVSKKHTPLKRQSPRNSRKAHDIPRHRRKLMRVRRRLKKQCLITTSEPRLNAIRRRLIEVEKQLQKSHNAESELEEKKAVDRIRTNSKHFFSYAKRFSAVKVGIGPLLDAADALISCPRRMGEILSNQYSSVFSKPVYTDAEIDEILLDDTSDVSPGLGDIDFNEDDISQAISEFSCNSAAGPDGFPAKLLKECKNSLSHPLFLIWRKSLNRGIVPASCKLASIIPIHKGKSRGLAKNYRPVALTSLIVKTFEKVLRRKLVAFFDEHNFFNNNQHGFRSARSCLSQLLAHFDHVTRLLENGNVVDVIYLDFSKAFDKVDIGITLQKLKTLGINGPLIRWLCSFLTGRSQHVQVNGVKSLPRPVPSGVPQGSVLGPLLFLILIGDIDKDVVNSFISSFADDTRVGRGVKSPADMRKLQSDLQSVYRWATQNNMVFNSEKFEHIRYQPSKTPVQYDADYLSDVGTPISTKTSLRDLGVTISDDATFSQYIEEKIVKMRSKIGWVLRTFRTRECRPMLTLWKALILSEHDYCSQLWNPHRKGLIQSLELLQYVFIKKIRNMSCLSYWEQLSTLNLYSLQRRRERYIIIYTWKILEGLVPNIAEGDASLSARWHQRRGRECQLPKVKSTAPVRIQTIRRSSFAVNGPRIFNSLPQHIRDITNCDLNLFKSQLDRFLRKLPDQPLIPGYTAYRQCETNSVIDWLGNAHMQVYLEESERQSDVTDLAAAIHGDHGQ